MVDRVKRGYRSERRAAQSDRTRREVVAAASRLFVEHGYGGTTMDAVAETAGVSRKTVFTAVGGKADLLKTALDWAVTGDDRPVPLVDRPEMRLLLDQRDAAAVLTGWAAMLTEIDARTAALFHVLETAAGVDDTAQALYDESQQRRHRGAADIVSRLIDHGALKPGLSREDAVDIAWLAGDPILFTRLVGSRGWPVDRFAEWLGAGLTAQLLA
jgi:AcrR family transcriptional regulator